MKCYVFEPDDGSLTLEIIDENNQYRAWIAIESDLKESSIGVVTKKDIGFSIEIPQEFFDKLKDRL